MKEKRRAHLARATPPAARDQRGAGSAPRAASSRGSAAGNQALQHLLRAAHAGGGEPISEAVRAPLEAGFGTSFADVRVHQGPAAQRAARTLHARAFTTGSQLVFAPGEYAPASADGRLLLAHELAHVVQQRGATGPAARVLSAGSPSEVEADRAARDVLAGSAPVLTPGSAAGIQRSPASDLINTQTSWGNLDESALGSALLQHVRDGEYPFVDSVLDELGSTDRDDVSYELAAAATDAELEALARSAAGRGLIDRLYDELTAGSVAEEEQAQADRLLAARARPLAPESGFEEVATAAKVFPFRLPGLTVLNDAPILAERRPGNRVWVKQPVRVLGTRTFAEETRTLPTGVFIGGIELPEDEIVGVRMYDLGGEVHYRPAIYLVQLANQTDTRTLETMGEAVGLGLTLGSGALIGGAARAAWLARALVWADRIAFALGTLTMVLRDHRGWIISEFGESGREFMRYVDLVNSAVALYGIGRAAVGLGQLVSGLRAAYRNWRTAARGLNAELSASERAVVQQVGQHTEDALDNMDELRAAARGAETPETAPPGGSAPTAAQAPEAPAPAGATPGGTEPPTASPVPRLLAAEADLSRVAARLDDIIRTGGPLPTQTRVIGAAIVDVPGYTGPREMRAISSAATDALGEGAAVFHAPTPDARTLSATRSIAGAGARREFPFSHINDAEMKLFEAILRNLPPEATGTIHFTTMRVRVVNGQTIIEPIAACSGCLRATFELAGKRGITVVSHAISHPTGTLDL